jgi:hypothetical protein
MVLLMKLKIIPILIVLLFFSGCVYQIEERAQYRYLGHYLSETVDFFELNGTGPNRNALVNNHFNLPNNGTYFLLNISWDASHEWVQGNNGLHEVTHNFTYHVELTPPDGTVCSPGNSVNNSTDLIHRTGHLEMICKLNNIPNETKYGSIPKLESEKNLIDLYQGAGQWYLNLSISPYYWCGNSHATTHWNMTAQLEQYYYVIERTK